MFKKLSLIFLSIITLVSCSSVYKHSAHDVLPREGYVFIKKVVNIHLCEPEKKKCKSDKWTAVGSGFVVKTTYKGSYVMTAEHVCRPPKVPTNWKQKTVMRVKTLSGRYFDAIILATNEKIDACMMFVEDLVTDVKEVKISPRAPKEGDKVYNIASPYGVQYSNVVPIFEGRYIGQRYYDDMYTFPAAPGSSGSMILNEKGELIGLLHSVFMRMKQVIVSVRYDDLKQFIQKNLIEHKQEQAYRTPNMPLSRKF